MEVRPLAGAGIEIIPSCPSSDWIGFAPSRGRELKWGCTAFCLSPQVRPLAGAGIEITDRTA